MPSPPAVARHPIRAKTRVAPAERVGSNDTPVYLIAIGGKPIFSPIILAIDGLIIYGLAAHGFGQNQR
jgi:hypothetical protein